MIFIYFPIINVK